MDAIIAATAGLLLGQALAIVLPFSYGKALACQRCGEPTPALTLTLPGYAVARGRCTSCRAALSWRALVLPAGCAGIFAAAAAAYDDFAGAALAAPFGSIFLALAVTDLETRLIPNRSTYPAVLAAIALSWAWPDRPASELLLGGLVGTAVAAGLLAVSLPFGRGAFGFGDVKMITLMGFVLGLPEVLVGIVIGVLSASAAAGLLLGFRLVGRRDYMPHAPFLMVGALTGLWFGTDIWDWYAG